MTEIRLSARPLNRAKHRGLPTLDQIGFYYIGDMEQQELTAMFQPMIDSGVIWHFPIDFIQTAAMLLQYGNCTDEKFPPRKAALERNK